MLIGRTLNSKVIKLKEPGFSWVMDAETQGSESPILNKKEREKREKMAWNWNWIVLVTQGNRGLLCASGLGQRLGWGGGVQCKRTQLVWRTQMLKHVICVAPRPSSSSAPSSSCLAAFTERLLTPGGGDSGPGVQGKVIWFQRAKQLKSTWSTPRPSMNWEAVRKRTLWGHVASPLPLLAPSHHQFLRPLTTHQGPHGQSWKGGLNHQILMTFQWRRLLPSESWSPESVSWNFQRE